MRFFETTPLKVLLLPLVPAAAIGIVTLAATLSPMQPESTENTIVAPKRQPCGFAQRYVGPPPAPPCTDCLAAAPA